MSTTTVPSSIITPSLLRPPTRATTAVHAPNSMLQLLEQRLNQLNLDTVAATASPVTATTALPLDRSAPSFDSVANLMVSSPRSRIATTSPPSTYLSSTGTPLLPILFATPSQQRQMMTPSSISTTATPSVSATAVQSPVEQLTQQMQGVLRVRRPTPASPALSLIQAQRIPPPPPPPPPIPLLVPAALSPSPTSLRIVSEDTYYTRDPVLLELQSEVQDYMRAVEQEERLQELEQQRDTVSALSYQQQDEVPTLLRQGIDLPPLAEEAQSPHLTTTTGAAVLADIAAPMVEQEVAERQTTPLVLPSTLLPVSEDAIITSPEQQTTSPEVKTASRDAVVTLNGQRYRVHCEKQCRPLGQHGQVCTTACEMYPVNGVVNSANPNLIHHAQQQSLLAATWNSSNPHRSHNEDMYHEEDDGNDEEDEEEYMGYQSLESDNTHGMYPLLFWQQDDNHDEDDAEEEDKIPSTHQHHQDKMSPLLHVFSSPSSSTTSAAAVHAQTMIAAFAQKEKFHEWQHDDDHHRFKKYHHHHDIPVWKHILHCYPRTSHDMILDQYDAIVCDLRNAMGWSDTEAARYALPWVLGFDHVFTPCEVSRIARLLQREDGSLAKEIARMHAGVPSELDDPRICLQ